MRIVFMGSAELARPSLQALLAGPRCPVACVVTQPDRPKGRGLKVSPSPVGQYAKDRGLPVHTTANVNAPDSLRVIREAAPDIVVVVAFGQILKKELLSIPPRGCVNLHASLLPKHRGAAPIQWAIAKGETLTGVTTMHMNEKMDAGDIIMRREVPIAPDDTGGSLQDKLAAAGAALLAETIEAVRAGTAPRIAQVEAEATFAPRLERADGRIDWKMPAAEIGNRVRAFNPWPACFCETPAGSGHFLKVLGVRVEQAAAGRPGQVLAWSGDGPLVMAGSGALRLLRVQPEGRKAMSGDAFMCGHPPMTEAG